MTGISNNPPPCTPLSLLISGRRNGEPAGKLPLCAYYDDNRHLFPLNSAPSRARQFLSAFEHARIFFPEVFPFFLLCGAPEPFVWHAPPMWSPLGKILPINERKGAY